MTEVRQPTAKRGRIVDVTKTSLEPPRNDTGTFMVERKKTLAQLDGDEEFIPATVDWPETPTQRERDFVASRKRLGLDKY